MTSRGREEQANDASDAAFPARFRGFIRALNAHAVEYMLVGGYAVGIHGYVRATTDIGFYYCSTADNIERLMRAMTVFGAPAALMATFPQRPNPLPHRRGNRCVVADEASRST